MDCTIALTKSTSIHNLNLGRFIRRKNGGKKKEKKTVALTVVPARWSSEDGGEGKDSPL
jgi:hypothetical protein